MIKHSKQVVVLVSILSAAIVISATISSNEVGYVAYASKEMSNCPKNNIATVQSASQVAIGNNIQQIIIQNSDQKGIGGNNNNNSNNCKHNHNGGDSDYSHDNYNNSNNSPIKYHNNNQYLVQNAEQNAIGDNNNQYLVQNSNQASFSGNLQQWIAHLKEEILSHMFDNIN
ncbi:MAG: hypothetical protein WA667_26410 [Candidatus Nitrosopolaris sp.]